MMSKKEIKVAMKRRRDSWECRTGVLAAFAVCGGGSGLACLPTVGLLACFCFSNILMLLDEIKYRWGQNSLIKYMLKNI